VKSSLIAHLLISSSVFTFFFKELISSVLSNSKSKSKESLKFKSGEKQSSFESESDD
jgi:hypothetical protein